MIISFVKYLIVGQLVITHAQKIINADKQRVLFVKKASEVK